MLSRLKKFLGLPSAAEENSGARGEAAAAEFLQREQAFSIVARNWRNPRDLREEIDGEVLVFVEVKTRAAAALVSGFHSVNARKKAVLRRAATAYLRTLQHPPVTFRLDVVEVVFAPGGAADVRHFANVRLFPKYFQP